MNKKMLLFFGLAILFSFSLAALGCGNGDDDDDDSGAADDDTTLDDDNDDNDDNDNDDNDNDNDDNDTGSDDDDDNDDNDDNDDDTTPVLGCIEGDYDPYWGNLHSHTSNSDGEEMPADAFLYARDTAGLDIMYVTDHLEQLYFIWEPKFNRWANCNEAADEYNQDGTYVAGCGYEYGSGFRLPFFQSTGHNNVFFCDYLMPIVQLDFHNFYQSLVECESAIGQFNHPGDEEYQNWNHFEYFADVDNQMNLYEFNSDPAWDLYFEALDAGWHISPMYNQDNHDADWGTKNGHRSGFFLADLTRTDLHTAMTERRSFASSDQNAYVKMLSDNTCWMGSILSSGGGDLTLNLEAYDADTGDGFTNIEIYGPGMALLGTIDCGGATLCTDTFEVTAVAPTYYVARANEADGDFLVAAPIWVQ